MKSSLSLFTKLLQQVFKKNHGSLILLRFAFSKKYFFWECVSAYTTYIYFYYFFCDQIFTRDFTKKISDYINISQPGCCMLMIFFSVLKKNVWIVLILLEKKIIMKWKYLMWQNAHKWGPHKIQYIHLVKVKYDSDKTGYWIFSCPRND